MAKPEWGTKRTCQACGARFYDLAHDPIVCPKCGEQQDPVAYVKQTRSRAAPEAKQPVKKKVAPEVEDVAESEDLDLAEDDIESVDDDEEDDLIEDASELGEDEEVIDALDEDDEDKST